MGLKKTRIILCAILTIICAFSVMASAISITMADTFGSESFYYKHWATDELVQECEKQLDARYSALSYKSGIPVEVFNAVKREQSTKESLTQTAQALFTDLDTSLYNDDRVNYFYNLCVTYLDANDYNYSKDDIMNVAKEATVIYAETLGVTNYAEINDFVRVRHSQSIAGFLIFSFFAVLCIFMIIIMYSKKEEGFVHIGVAFAAGGLGELLFSLVALITGVYDKVNIMPVAYDNVIRSLRDYFFAINVVVGLGVTALGGLILFLCFRKIGISSYQDSTRFSKLIGKM